MNNKYISNRVHANTFIQKTIDECDNYPQMQVRLLGQLIQQIARLRDELTERHDKL